MKKLICKIFGHKWKRTHEELMSDDSWYYVFFCTRCHEKESVTVIHKNDL